MDDVRRRFSVEAWIKNARFNPIIDKNVDVNYMLVNNGFETLKNNSAFMPTGSPYLNMSSTNKSSR